MEPHAIRYDTRGNRRVTIKSFLVDAKDQVVGGGLSGETDIADASCIGLAEIENPLPFGGGVEPHQPATERAPPVEKAGSSAYCPPDR